MTNDFRFQCALNCLSCAETKELAQHIFDSIKGNDDFSIFWDYDKRKIEFFISSKYEITIREESE